jgi:hypothetical protein
LAFVLKSLLSQQIKNKHSYDNAWSTHANTSGLSLQDWAGDVQDQPTFLWHFGMQHCNMKASACDSCAQFQPPLLRLLQIERCFEMYFLAVPRNLHRRSQIVENVAIRT